LYYYYFSPELRYMTDSIGAQFKFDWGDVFNI